ncbi:MAG: hypothetical protein ACI86C_001122 [Candidatus Latescibacterota bacterium]|jgi:hypothetical protein
MKFLKNWYKPTLLVVFISLSYCNEPIDSGYSFFVAGHTYGKPNVNNKGFHPPFKAKFDVINNDANIDFGVLTGDVVIYGTPKCWDDVDADIALLNTPVYFAVGNHDMKNKSLFESRYGDTYQSFIHKDDLFIILDPNLDHWNISGAQLEYLKNSLDIYQDKVTNIFVFFHQVLWWKQDIDNEAFILNSLQDRADTINFYDEVEPLFRDLSNPVFMFAGDVGATRKSNGYYYRKDTNITYVASGMGGPINPNFVIVDVDVNKEVSLRVIPLDDK